MKQILLLFTFVSFALIIHAQGPVRSLPKTIGKYMPGAEWTTLRGNNNRDGRVVAIGDFKNGATLRQSVDYSTSEAYVELSPSGKNSSVKYNAGETSKSDLRTPLTTEWQTETMAYLDLSGDGRITTVATGQWTKYATLFNGDPKYYRIEAIDGFGVVSNAKEPVFVGIRVYEGNSNNLKFEKRFKKGVEMQRPHVTVADMNNDGEKDIVITSWEGVYVFNSKGDSIAGLSQEVSGWHHLRKRGFTCIADIDGNGFKDVVIIGAFPYHVDVIKNEGGVLKFGWTEIFDGHIESATRISKPVLNSVNDFDGDGTYEILVNVFNYNNENNWSGLLYDASSGKVKAQIKGAYVLSAEDVSHNGKYVFFCTETHGQSVPPVATLKVVTFTNVGIKEVLRIEKSEWINPRLSNTSPTLTTHNDGVSSIAEDAVLCIDYENIGQKAFFTKIKKQDGSALIQGYYVAKDGTAKKTTLGVNIPSGMYGEIIRGRKNADGKSSLLLQIKAFGAPAGTVQIAGANAKNRGRYVSTGKKICIPVVADLNADGFAEILIANEVGEVMCFGGNSEGTMSLQWKVPGHGMALQYALSIDYGVSVDDINHDGFKEVIVSGADEAGAVLFLYDRNGKLLWQKGFPEINAGDMTTFDGNIAFFGTAQSTKRKSRDVIVTVQRVIQHTGKTYCLSGVDGSVIWELNTLKADNGRGGMVESGAGGNIFSTYDIDGDGADEVMCGYGNIVFLLT